jgi:hypothetical protein
MSKIISANELLCARKSLFSPISSRLLWAGSELPNALKPKKVQPASPMISTLQDFTFSAPASPTPAPPPNFANQKLPRGTNHLPGIGVKFK